MQKIQCLCFALFVIFMDFGFCDPQPQVNFGRRRWGHRSSSSEERNSWNSGSNDNDNAGMWNFNGGRGRGGWGGRCQYLGCFRDSDYRILRVGPWQNYQMTVEMCQSHCRNNGYSFAGLQHDQKCWCDYQPQYQPTQAPNGCQVVCGGNSQQKCGGVWETQLYRCSGGRGK